MHLITTDAFHLPEDDDILSLRNFAHFLLSRRWYSLQGNIPLSLLNL